MCLQLRVLIPSMFRQNSNNLFHTDCRSKISHSPKTIACHLRNNWKSTKSDLQRNNGGIGSVVESARTTVNSEYDRQKVETTGCLQSDIYIYRMKA